jgi:Ser/Thr protein kinase RdoA (MazF antagonist)
MLLISELVRFGRLLDDDRHCPVADEAAARWAAGRPVFLRSSASHVLVCGRSGGPRVVLRMRPGSGDAADVLGRGARVARDWQAAGGPVAGAVRSVAGSLLEMVGGYAVTALEAVAGDALDGDALAPSTAYVWGSTVAGAHATGSRVERTGLPTTESYLDGTGAVPAGLTGVAVELREALDRLPRDAAVHGLLHGDPEPDNVVVGPGGGQVLVDPDDVRVGWFVSDVGFALRAWAPADDPCAVPDLAAPVPSAFLSGYRSVRPLTDEELGWLPLLARVAAWEDWCGLQPQVAEPADPDWPVWARALDTRVRTRVDRLAAALVR